MNNSKFYVSFPFDDRPDESRNDFLDGLVHEMFVEHVYSLSMSNLQFYIVEGFDFLRNSGVRILLTDNGKELKKLPLYDYKELDNYESKARVLSNGEMQEFLSKYNHNISSLPITTISDFVKEHTIKKEITVFCDPDGRKFISTKDAISLGYDNPRDVSFLPTEKIIGRREYKLITEEEYEDVKRKYIISEERVGKLDVLYYKDNYYVDWLAAQSGEAPLTGFQFSGLDNFVSNEEPLSKFQLERIKKYYSINLLTEKELKKGIEDYHKHYEQLNGGTQEISNVDVEEDELEKERKRIMKARFSDETKQRLLAELEQEQSEFASGRKTR